MLLSRFRLLTALFPGFQSHDLLLKRISQQPPHPAGSYHDVTLQHHASGSNTPRRRVTKSVEDGEPEGYAQCHPGAAWRVAWAVGETEQGVEDEETAAHEGIAGDRGQGGGGGGGGGGGEV